jgi:hypothetical protein
LISCSDDRTIKVWDQDYVCIETIEEDWRVSSMALLEDDILVYALSVGLKLRRLDGYGYSVNVEEYQRIHHVIKLSSGGFATCYRDNTVRIWNP